MKKLLLTIVLVCCNYMFAQPTILYTGLNSTTPSPSNNRFVLTDLGIFKQYRFQANQNQAASTTGWAFHIGSTAMPDYSANWRASSGGNTLSVNNFIPIGFANGANYTNNAGVDGLLPNITSNNYYTFNIDSGSGNVSYPMALLETTYDPTVLLSQSVVPPLASNGAAKVTVTAAAPLNSGEYVYMRYASVFNFTGSTLIEIPFVGSTGNFFMPCFPAGTNIYYYFFSSNKTKAVIDAEYIANSSNESVYDMSTLRLLNNGGPNYTYAQPTTAATDFAGNYFIPSTCYPLLNTFVTALNAGTVVGPVTVNIASGHLETAPAGGIEITKSGTATNTLTFIKDGVGANPVFTASNGHTISKITDAVIKIVGADYITIDGLTLLENNANTVKPTTTNNMTEYGVAFFYAGTSATANGAQNNTIKNCTIDLDRTYTNTFGIFSNSNVIATDAGATNQSSNFAGSNSNLIIIRNTITDVNQGIVVVGSGSSSSAHNNGLVIGGALGDGNIIGNFGTGSPLSTFNFVASSINGIVVRNTKNFNISYNTITSSTAPNISTVRGVFIDSFSQAPTGILAHTISNNIISLANGSSGAGIEGISINSTTGNATTTININNNDFNNFTANTGSNGVTFIKNYQTGTAININDNTFTNLTINNTSFANYFIDMGSTSSTSTGVQNINGNKIVSAFTKNGASGNLGIYNGTGSSVTGAIVNNNNNEFSNITLSGGTFIEGWRNTDGGSISSPSKTVDNNKFENWTGGTGSKTIIFINGFGGTSSISSNTINNINTIITGVNSIKAINIGSNGLANLLNIKNNIITNINCGTGVISGILTDTKSTSVNVESNQIKNFLGAGSILAVESINSSPTLITISGNDIDNLKSSGSGSSELNGIKNGVNVLFKIENNSIKNIEATNAGNSSNVRGINITNAFATITPPIINNNVIDNLISASTSASTTMAGIAVAASANHEITNNTVKNLISNTSNSGTAGSTAVTGIWTSSSGTAQKINNNTIFNIAANNASSVSTGVAGILTSALSTAGSEIYQNRVYGLKNLSTGISPIISGYLNAGGGVWTTANNMISIDNGANTNGVQIFGINDIGNNGARKYYFNSINIEGTSTALNSTAFQFKRTAAAGTADIRNNIFNMKRTGGSSKNYAVANTGTFTTPATATYNYNIFNASIAAQTGLIDTTDQTFVSWKTATAGDANSFNNEIITFTDVTIADLHLLAGANCDSGKTGTPVAITTDFDNQTRDLTLPTIGADETTRTNTNWNGTAWNNGTPTLSKLASFSANYDMATQPSIDACSVTIGNGLNTPIVTITSGKYLNIQNDLTTNTGAKLNVLDKGSLVMVNNSGIVTNNGTTNISRLTPSFDRYDYTYWSAPTFNPQIGTPLAAWNLTRAYSFTTANYFDNFSGNSYPQNVPGADTFDDNGDDWTFVPSSTPMAAGVGYAVMGNAIVGVPNTTETVTFSGKVNNGLVTSPLALSANLADNNDDFNLVGNPYPSSIKADDFIKANILPLGTGNNISGTLYFWSHKGNVEPVLTNPGPSVFNYNANDYASYNLTGSTITSSPSGSGSAPPDGFIGSGQGFMVEAEVATDLVFRNSLRNKAYSNNQFFKNNSNAKDRFWLNFQNVDNMFSQQLIGYLPDTSLNYDYGYDGIESKSQNYVSFYSFMNNVDLLTYKIQSRDLFDVNDYIKLGYTSAVSGQTSISIDRTEGIFGNQDIYLQDNLLSITHNLKLSPYTFTTNFGTFNDRFILKYVNTTLSNIAYANDENAIKIAVKDAKISLISNNENIKSIQIFDILSRNIYDNQAINTKTFVIENLLSKNQVLIVKTKLENGVVVATKIIL